MVDFFFSHSKKSVLSIVLWRTPLKPPKNLSLHTKTSCTLLGPAWPPWYHSRKKTNSEELKKSETCGYRAKKMLNAAGGICRSTWTWRCLGALLNHRFLAQENGYRSQGHEVQTAVSCPRVTLRRAGKLCGDSLPLRSGTLVEPLSKPQALGGVTLPCYVPVDRRRLKIRLPAVRILLRSWATLVGCF